ncbi:hypothetical protein M8J77_021110 [Diaphorina citri]|nr:hypothetical protein M8J77_021110 [Diaphorina citri]
MLKILGGRKKGLRRQTLMKLYHAYILPVLDYGSIVYGSARTKELDKLNVVHHTALRIPISRGHLELLLLGSSGRLHLVPDIGKIPPADATLIEDPLEHVHEGTGDTGQFEDEVDYVFLSERFYHILN